MDNITYKRNWMYEQMATVQFLDGSEKQCFCQSDKGRITMLKIEHEDGTETEHAPDEFGLLGIEYIHFMTPARCEVDIPYDVMGRTYLALGRFISEGDTMRKVAIRSRIAEYLHKRDVNIHDLIKRIESEE